MKLFVGLGNPGRSYAKHRHNVGFMAVEAIAGRFDFAAWKSRFSGDVSDGRVGDTRVLILKPQTYMNESGRAVAEAARYLKIAPEDVFVFYDEIDLAPGKLKVKTGGGNAGHNGLRSVTQHFDNDYQRVRIGVGHPGQKDQVANYVLSNFAKTDKAWLEPMLDEIARASPHLAAGDQARFLSEVARAVAPDQYAKSTSKTAASDRSPGSAAPDPSEASPASEPQQARQKPEAKASSALADSLKKWLSGSTPKR